MQRRRGSMDEAFGDDTPGWFERFANAMAAASGRPIAAAMAFAGVLVWAVTGPMFHFSDTWQLVINTGTTVLTFLMVFVVQSTVNRGTMAIQLKLDELLRVSTDARDALVGAETLSEKAIRTLEDEERSQAGHDA
jgi:low affinity Fe/Cu permease